MHTPQPHCKVVSPSPNHTPTRSDMCIDYYTPLPVNLANKQQASNKHKHFSFLFLPLLRLVPSSSTLPQPSWSPGGALVKSKL